MLDYVAALQEMCDYLPGVLDGGVTPNNAQGIRRHLFPWFMILDAQLEDIGA